MQMPLLRMDTDCMRANNLGVRGCVMSPFSVSSIVQPRGISKVCDGQAMGARLHHQGS